MTGTLRVDFAGTREEARAFVAEHRPVLHLAHGRDREVPELTTRYQGYEQREAQKALLSALGWDNGAVQDVWHA